MRADLILCTVAVDGRKGPGIILRPENIAETFALKTMIEHGIHVGNYGSELNDVNFSCLLCYSLKEAVSGKTQK